jgi:hypothetical protein
MIHRRTPKGDPDHPPSPDDEPAEPEGTLPPLDDDRRLDAEDDDGETLPLDHLDDRALDEDDQGPPVDLDDSLDTLPELHDDSDELPFDEASLPDLPPLDDEATPLDDEPLPPLFIAHEEPDDEDEPLAPPHGELLH